ncbi:DUF1870 family protein [Rhodococcus hoagii]|nr:DUF1870 family protein [Prescottella equi]
MADTDRRSGAELRARRELLGLNAQETAALLGVDERVIRRWEQGKPIPEGVVAELAQLEQVQDDVIRELEDTAKTVASSPPTRATASYPTAPNCLPAGTASRPQPRSATSQPTESTPESSTPKLTTRRYVRIRSVLALCRYNGER